MKPMALFPSEQRKYEHLFCPSSRGNRQRGYVGIIKDVAYVSHSYGTLAVRNRVAHIEGLMLLPLAMMYGMVKGEDIYDFWVVCLLHASG